MKDKSMESIEDEMLKNTISKEYCEELMKIVEKEIVSSEEKTVIYIKKKDEDEIKRMNEYINSYIQKRKIMFDFIKERKNKENIAEITNEEWKQLSEQTQGSYQDLREKIKGINIEDEILEYLGYNFKNKVRKYRVNCNDFDEIEIYKKLKQFVYLSRIFNFKAKNANGDRIIKQTTLAKIFNVKQKTIQFFENCFI